MSLARVSTLASLRHEVERLESVTKPVFVCFGNEASPFGEAET